MTTPTTPYTPITDRLEAEMEPSAVPVRVFQVMRALEADRTELVGVLGRFAVLDKSVNSDLWAIDRDYCAHARTVIEGLFRG